MSMNNTPWVCPECGYAPTPTQIKRNGPLFYEARDVRVRCSRMRAQAATGTRLKCPHFDTISDRVLALR